MNQIKNNVVLQLFHNFKDKGEHEYIHQTEDYDEVIAFAHGMIAAIYLLEKSPEDIIDTSNGTSLSQALDEILVSKTDLQ